MSTHELLSKDEMHTLLHEPSGQPAGRHHAADDGVRPHFYDFISEYHKSITKSRGFELINLNFASELREQLHRTLRVKPLIDIIEPEIATFEQYLQNNHEPSLLNMLRVDETDTYLLMMLDKQLLFSGIEILFGSTPSQSASLNREFAHVDFRIAKLFCQRITEALQHAWESILNLQLELVKTTKEHLIPNNIKRSEKIIILQYRITIDTISSRLDICLPHSLVNGVSDQLNHDDISKKPTEEDSDWAHTLRNNLHNANINLSAEITETDILLKDVLALKVGDVISIDNPSVGYLLAEGEKIFRVNCGVQDGTKVVEVIERITD